MSSRDGTVRMWGVLASVSAIALALRLGPLLASGGLVNALEYDGGVMFAGTLHLLAGRTPFTDFVYLHPPGSLLLFAPAGVMANVLGEPHALAVVRIGIVLAGTANTLLIGLLLRRFGLSAVLVGAGLYAVWPVVAFTERMIMLEPILNLCLLAALMAVREGARRTGSWLAGVLLALALSVKLWAVIDVVIVGALIFCRFGWRGLWRYVVAGALTAGVVILPIFLRAPLQMWDQTVLTQLSRPPGGASLAARVNMLSAFWTTPLVDAIVPWVVWAALWGFLLALALVPVVVAIRTRTPPHRWRDAAWWGIIALVHAVVIAGAAVFYDHYTPWLIAPLALTTGAAMTRLQRPGMRSAAAIVAVSALAIVALAQSAPRTAVADVSPLRTWAMGHACVWGTADLLIAADSLRRNLARECEMDVDVYGVGLTLRAPGASDRESENEDLSARITSQLLQADGAMLSVIPDRRPLTPATDRWFRNEFAQVGGFGDVGLWERTDH